MSEFPGKTVVTIDKLTVDHDTRTYSGAECDHYEIFQTACHTIGHLTDRCGIRIVGDCYGDTELLAEKLRERHGGRPGKVYTILDHTGEVVCIGCTDSDTVYLILSIDRLDKTHSLCVEFVDVVGDVSVFSGLDRVACKHNSAGINNAEHCVGSAHVDAYHVRLGVVYHFSII